MKTIVRFRTPTGAYALPVEHVTEVRLAAELRPLPAPQAGVAGVMSRGDDVITVLSVLGETGRQVVVIDDVVTYGLLVDEVTGVHRVEDDVVGPPPHGQDGDAVAGVIVEDGGVVLLLDTAALRGRLSA